MNWLLPAFACLVLTCAIGRRTTPSGILPGSPMTSAALSNQLLAVCIPDTTQVEWNILENTFDWTNGGGTPSTIPSLFPR
jgi:hypothetical protein